MRVETGLGVAPLVLIGAGSVITSGLYQAEESYNSGFLNNLFQTLGLKDTPKLPMSNPVLSPPVAPQTEHGMKYWSPEWQNEAAQQKQVQYRADQDAWAAANDKAKDRKDPDSTLVILALVAATAVGVGLLLKR